MGFREIRARAIQALRDGTIQHEARDEINEKNLLLTGVVNPEQVIRLLGACRGNQYSCSPRHVLRTVEVHVFKPEASLVTGEAKECWYIKLYVLEPNVWFISVHRSRSGVKP